MKMTIINPPWFFLNEMNYFPQNLGLRYIISFLQSKSHQVKFIDALRQGRNQVKKRIFAGRQVNQIGLDYFSIANLIPNDSDYIGLGVPFTFLAPVARELIGIIKSKVKAPVIIGGVFPSTSPNHAIKSGTDYIVKGEGELSLAELLSGTKPENINGFSSVNFDNGQAKFVFNLDDLPFPYRGNEFEEYLSFSSRGRKNMKTASIITSRGCPHNCDFCSTHPTAGFKWRPRTPNNVLDEIIYLNKKFGINHIEIEDDNFTLDKSRTNQILEEIVEYNGKTDKPLSFSTPNGLRIDTMDEEIVALMKRAGFTSMYLALESGDSDILKLMNKKLSLERVYEVAQAAAKYDMPILYFLMIGYPGETREKFLNSISFCLKLKKVGKCSFTTFLTRAYPGTKLFDYCLAKGYITSDAEKDIFLGSLYQITTPDFTGCLTIHYIFNI